MMHLHVCCIATGCPASLHGHASLPPWPTSRRPASPTCRPPQKHEKARREKAGGAAVEEVDENFTRLYWEQMLQVWGAEPVLRAGRSAGWRAGRRRRGGAAAGAVHA